MTDDFVLEYQQVASGRRSFSKDEERTAPAGGPRGRGPRGSVALWFLRPTADIALRVSRNPTGSILRGLGNAAGCTDTQ
mgnify:CR=1 FL=1